MRRMGEKDGKGVSGDSSTICPECLARENVLVIKYDPQDSSAGRLYLTRKGKDEIKRRMRK
jgi:hypothetical protein